MIKAFESLTIWLKILNNNVWNRQYGDMYLHVEIVRN